MNKLKGLVKENDIEVFYLVLVWLLNKEGIDIVIFGGKWVE